MATARKSALVRITASASEKLPLTKRSSPPLPPWGRAFSCAQPRAAPTDRGRAAYHMLCAQPCHKMAFACREMARAIFDTRKSLICNDHYYISQISTPKSPKSVVKQWLVGRCSLLRQVCSFLGARNNMLICATQPQGRVSPARGRRMPPPQMRRARPMARHFFGLCSQFPSPASQPARQHNRHRPSQSVSGRLAQSVCGYTLCICLHGPCGGRSVLTRHCRTSCGSGCFSFCRPDCRPPALPEWRSEGRAARKSPEAFRSPLRGHLYLGLPLVQKMQDSPSERP